MLSFSFGRKRKTGAGLVGLAIEPDGLALAHVVRDERGHAELRCCEFFDEDDEEQRLTSLREAVHRNGLQDVGCVCLLGSGSYTLRLAERPENVTNDELRDSARWLVRDLLDFDPNEAEIGVFDFPQEATGARVSRMYVAAARNQVVADAAGWVERAGLKLESIDIPELALRNVVGELPEAVAGTAMLKLESKSSLLALYHDDHLYLARAIAVDAAALDASLEQTHPDGDDLQLAEGGLLDSLLLEIQRSLDYYESELRKAPASRLIIAPADCETSLIVPAAAELLRPMPVSTLDLSDVAHSPEAVPERIQARCLTAVGAALSGDTHQRLDLRPVAPKAESRPFSFSSLLRVAATTAFALVLLAGAGFWQSGEQRALLQVLEKQRDHVQARIQDFHQRFPTPTRDPDFARRVQSLQAQQRAKSRLMQELERSQMPTASSFSSHMEGLARQPVKGLWLTHIEIRGGGAALALEGRTRSPRLLPALLQRLAEEPAFAGKRFGVLRMTSSEDLPNVTEFALQSRGEDEASAPKRGER